MSTVIARGVAMSGRAQRFAQIAAQTDYSELVRVVRLDLWSLDGAPKVAIGLALSAAQAKALAQNLEAAVVDMKRWHRRRAKLAAPSAREAA